MTQSRSDGRQLLSVTMQPELFHRIKSHCKHLDVPTAVWVRQLLKEHLDQLEASNAD